MSLNPLQEQIIRTALVLPQARTLALAGGCAVIVHGLVDRTTRDVDLFTEGDADEARELCAALRAVLASNGLRIKPAARPPHENRFIAVEPETGAEMAVEVFPDGGRLRPPTLLALGPVLHPEDLAADKTLALWGRAEPRDFLDVITLRDHFGGTRLLELAAEKDRGFTLPTFLEALNSIKRISPQRWAAAGISENHAGVIHAAVEEWRIELEPSTQQR